MPISILYLYLNNKAMNELNKELEKLYLSKTDGIFKMYKELNESGYDDFSYPLLLHVWEEEYSKAPVKLMIIGQETNGWGAKLETSDHVISSMQNYKDSIKEMMMNYIDKYNAYFVFLPQVIADTNNDTIIAKEIRGLITEEYKKNIVIIEDDLSPEELKTLIGNFDYFIGTRMHSNIFATSMRIPNIVIAYEKKTNGIMEIVGLEDYVLEIDTVTSDELISKIDKCINNKTKIINYLNTKIPELKQEILEKIDKVMKNY